MKNSNSAYIFFFILFLSITSSAQKESVILYNSQPVKVELTEKGNIQSFIGLVPGYMAGFDMTPVIDIPSNVSNTSAENTENTHEGYAIISIDRVDLNYKPNFATLDRAVINKLNTVAAKLKVEPKTRILLTAYTSDQKANKLSTNRLDSAIAYLGLKGIPSTRIQQETQQSSDLLNVLTVAYLK